ncbi:hypothetical protein M5K25_018058 [Dendrobium thyrsiflorum]|uniref:Uncharacterized protein n=1 Tax=Dendrobium thyrsiflorum TaxID=117978 RepID=A0ABD0UH68_DENTH
MNLKYCKVLHPLLSSYKRNDSLVWKRLCSIKWEAENYIQWGLGKGDISFWQDNWLGFGSIDSILNSHTIENRKVKSFFINNSWNVFKLREAIPDYLIDIIMSIPLQMNCNDKILFSLSNSGRFNLKEVWNTFRIKYTASPIYSVIWNANIPLSYSILVWRCIKNCIPVDVNLWKKGFKFPSKCQCCYSIETINHVFINGAIAAKVWNYFFRLTNKGTPNLNIDVCTMLNVWVTKSKGHICNVIPIFVMWFLWKARNDSKHNNIRMNAEHVISAIRNKIVQLYSVNLISFKNFHQFSFLAHEFGIYHHNAMSPNLVKMVRWIKPSLPFVKLNTDGSVGSNFSGAGGIIRNEKGSLLAAFASPLNVNNVITAELLGLAEGLDLCNKLGFNFVEIEVDAEWLIQIFVKGVDGSPQNFYVIRKIKHQLAALNYSMSHIYREANACADWLAKYGCHLDSLIVFNSENLPPMVNGFVKLDKIGMPYIRAG